MTAMDVTCPTCKARPDEPCRKPQAALGPHKARVLAAERAARDWAVRTSDRLAAATRVRQKADRAAEQARDEQADAIRDAVADGVPVAQIAAVTGLSGGASTRSATAAADPNSNGPDHPASDHPASARAPLGAVRAAAVGSGRAP
jgi:hypothetical protein